MTKEELEATISKAIMNCNNPTATKLIMQGVEQYANQRALEIAEDAYDTGSAHEYNAHFGKVPNPTPDKETYLFQLKTKLSQP